MSRRFQGGESSEILGQNTVKNEDMFQCRHEVGTVNDSDKAVPLSVIQSCPVATCETAGGSAAKVGVVNNFSDFTLLNGREVLVYFASGNTADNPTFNLNNTGAFPLALENQLSTVSIGSGCWGDDVFLHLKYVDITVSNTRIQKWLICGHRIASQSSTQTTYADGQGRTNTVASGNMHSVTSGAVYSALLDFRSIHSIKVGYQQSITIPFSVWGNGICMGNIDGAGNFCFAFSCSGAGDGANAINNWSTGTVSFNASLSGNTVTVGTTDYSFQMIFNSNNTITFNWVGVSADGVYARIAFMGMSSETI